MVSAKMTIVNPTGLHMRPASKLTTAAGKYQCSVDIVCGEKTINGKSLMNVMAAGLTQGSEIELRCSGPDEAVALECLRELIESGLGE